MVIKGFFFFLILTFLVFFISSYGFKLSSHVIFYILQYSFIPIPFFVFLLSKYYIYFSYKPRWCLIGRTVEGCHGLAWPAWSALRSEGETGLGT